MGRPLAGLLALTLTMATATACGGESEPGAEGKVNVGVIPIVDVAPLYLGKQKGFFDQHKINLNITPITGGAAAIPGLVSGQLTFAYGNVTSLLIARDKGLDLKIVANGDNSTGKIGADVGAVMVKKNSPIKTAKDLAGKRVSTNTLKNVCDTMIRQVTRKDGGNPDKIKFVEVPFPDAPAAVERGRVDAACVVEPFVTLMKAKGARSVSSMFAEAVPNLTIATYFTTGKLAREQPDLVKRFQAAMSQSLAYAQAHPDEMRAVLKTYTKIPPEAIAKITLPSWGEVNKQSIVATGDLAQRDGLLKKKPDIAALFP